MNPNRKKTLLIVGGAVVLIVLALVVSKVDFDKFYHVNINIMKSISEGSHDIFMGKEVSVEYIKNNTGCTNEIDVKELPQEFRPVQKYTHPPYIMGACQVCHAPKRSKPAAIITPTVQELCYKCHLPVQEPREQINCNKCHNPHHAQKDDLLRKKVTDTECPVGEFQF